MTLTKKPFDKSKGYDLSNKKFGMLKVVEYYGVDTRGERLWKCVCDCGNEKIAKSYDLRKGKTDNCGCMRYKRIGEKNRKHGLTNTHIYRVWGNMKTRCTNPKNDEYHNYGGKGIMYCDEWDEFINFYEWSIKNGYDETLSIDRIDNDKDYSPDNCRWVTMREQQNNRSNNRIVVLNGEEDTLANWSRRLGIKYKKLQHLLNKGLRLEDIVHEK